MESNTPVGKPVGPNNTHKQQSVVVPMSGQDGSRAGSQAADSLSLPLPDGVVSVPLASPTARDGGK